MANPLRDAAVLQQDNGASHSAKGNIAIYTIEEPRSPVENGGSTDALVSVAASGSTPDRSADVSANHNEVEDAAKASDISKPASEAPQDETGSSASLKTQPVEHISWMERRINSLENEIRSLRNGNLYVS